MRPASKICVLAVLAFQLSACPTENGAGAASTPAAIVVPPEVASQVSLEVVVDKLAQPVVLTAPAGDPGKRLFVVEKTGKIRIIRDGAAAAEPFLDLSAQVSGASEQGLLGLAFHPRYAETRRFVVNYTDRSGDTRIVEYSVPADSPDRADPASARELLMIDQPYANHNGGDVVFGPDGKLYVGTGDGGSANDPKGNGQNKKALLGKMLRLDVDAAQPGTAIVAIGLRNPWRYAFDMRTRDLYIGDVGQNRYEEVDVVALADLDGKNFGWNVMEGRHCLSGGSCSSSGMTPPVVEYDHASGCSITGGMVYHGSAIPALDGVYFYADYCTALLRSFRWKDGAVVDHWDWKAALDPRSRLAQITSFGEDADGELYLLSQGGTVYRLAPAQRKK